MKKIKIKYLIYSLFFAIFMSCDNVNNEVLNSESKQVESEKLLDHFSEINRIKEATIGSIYSLSNNKLSRDEIETNIIKTINKGSKTVNYSFLIKNNGFLNKGTVEDLNIEDLNLPEETVFYLNKLKNLNEKQDYQSIIVLMEEFKEDYSENPANLVSLIGVFSVLEIYKDEMVSTVKNRGCSLSGSAVGGAAISGAISGAIWGAKLGSWLGPAGTVWGAIGGAIASATLSSIVSIGVQILTTCESRELGVKSIEKVTDNYIEKLTKDPVLNFLKIAQ